MCRHFPIGLRVRSSLTDIPDVRDDASGPQGGFGSEGFGKKAARTAPPPGLGAGGRVWAAGH